MEKDYQRKEKTHKELISSIDQISSLVKKVNQGRLMIDEVLPEIQKLSKTFYIVDKGWRLSPIESEQELKARRQDRVEEWGEEFMKTSSYKIPL